MNVPTLAPRMPGLSRRVALTATVGTLAAGTACTPNSANVPDRRGSRERRPEPDPDVALAATVLADEGELLARIDATIADHPRLGALLADARDAHAAHVALLEDAAPDGPSPSASPGATSSDDAGSTRRVPRDPDRALLALARREDRLALVDKRSAFAAESGAFARVLASMASSAAQHGTLLRRDQAARGNERVP